MFLRISYFLLYTILYKNLKSQKNILYVSKNLKRLIEQEVYDAIDEIADEFKLNVPIYPEVYYVHKNLKFESLGYVKEHKESFQISKYENESFSSFKPSFIFIGTWNTWHIFEEAGHFLHISQSNLKIGKRSQHDVLATHVLDEMIGYFCSKIGNSSRKPMFRNLPDAIHEREKCIKITEKNGWDFYEFLVYQQGYGLGEKLFNYYISNIISRKKIKKLFTNPLEKKNEALLTFHKLKNNILE